MGGLQENPLDVRRDGSRKPGYRNPRVIAAFVVGGVMALMFISGIIALESHIAAMPQLVMLMPILGGLSVFLLLPLVLFVCYQEDFVKVNPMWPPHYWFLLKKTVNAIQTNNWKITAKDL